MDIENIRASVSSGRGLPGELAGCRAYPNSIHTRNGALYFMARSATERFLVVGGRDALPDFEGTPFHIDTLPAKKCALTPGNARALSAAFPFAAPSSHRDAPFTMGLGDRLGMASPGHIRAVRGRGIFPVLAQQSMRELKLTGRTYEDVLAAAAFAVFQEDWREGWGADGDHLKTAEEIRYALACGYTMITLDCSAQINGAVQGMDKTAVAGAYAELPEDVRRHYEGAYAERHLNLDGASLSISCDALKETVLVYYKAIDYAAEIYRSLIAPCGRPVDFEVSIDETALPTAPCAHYVIASELALRGVKLVSMAPRFTGEFQKGIDYIGNPQDFERDFIAHQRIAAHFGYKLSIHSGSDKFAVFGIIGRHTGLRVHVKTAGTNWLEALRVASGADPALFREMLSFALEHLHEARAYYHVRADAGRVAAPGDVPNERLGEYLDQPDARQVLHIAYGLLLEARNPDGSPQFKHKLYALLHGHEEEYAAALQRHIGRHIDTIVKGRGE